MRANAVTQQTSARSWRAPTSQYCLQLIFSHEIEAVREGNKSMDTQT